MENKERLEQLYSLKLSIESKAFQEEIIKPLFAELDSLKSASKCKTWEDVCELRGEEKGLKFLVKLLKEVDRQIKNIKHDIEKSGS